MISYICYHDDGIQIIKNSNEITMQTQQKNKLKAENMESGK